MRHNRSNNSEKVFSKELIQATRASVEETLNSLNSSYAGLTDEEAANRIKIYGYNEIAHDKPPKWYAQFFESFINPFIGILFALSIISLITDVIFTTPLERSYKTIVVIATMIIISSTLRFWQEFRSSKAAEKLQAMVSTTVTVLRDNYLKEIPITEVVPGDIIKLSAGDMIPADIRLLSSKDLFISEAVLTGESLPVEKYDTLGNTTIKSNNNNVQVSPLDFSNICFMGTNVVSGTATALSVATGNSTYFGSMTRDIAGKRAITSFDKGISEVSWILIRFTLVMAPLVFLINGFTKHNWIESLMFSLSVAVGLTPEMLPMIVTANLAKGAVNMAKRKTIIKRLNSIQNFGAMDILCTDKTGTLTQDKIILERHLDASGEDNIHVLEYAYLNSLHQTGFRNLLDTAILEYGRENELDYLKTTYRKIDEIPFDFVRRRMSIIVESTPNEHLLVCKGAVEEILGLCSGVDDNDGNIVNLDQEKYASLIEMMARLNEDGLRVLAVAYKRIVSDKMSYNMHDESDMVLAGYIAFLDPPKETAAHAIEALKKHGVNVKVITGDNAAITCKICKAINLDVEGVLLGQEIDNMSDEELASRLGRTTIFAKMSPIQKSRIVRLFQSKGHTVGYLGDGINDAPALRKADVGISVDTAVDIAKESADIILLEKSLMILEEGIIEGRKTFGNIIKYIKMTASSNFGNVFSILGASIFLPFLPMLPLQLLVQNLLYDFSQVSIPWDNVDAEYLEKPRKWSASGISRFMIHVGPISSIFDFATFAAMWFIFGANVPEKQSLFQSGWFVVGLVTQTLVVHMIRTKHIPFIHSRAATSVLLCTATIISIGIYLPFSIYGKQVGFTNLPLLYFGWLALVVICYCSLVQIVKIWYIKKYNQWL